MKTVYTGRASTFEEQIATLRSYGLEIGDEKRAIQILSNVSYSRLKAYMFPLVENKSTWTFRKGASLEQVYTIYGFDRRLRELIFHELEKIEISIRTRMAYATSEDGDGFWYTNPAYFKNPRFHANLLRKISSEVSRSDNDALHIFQEKYSNEYPPCWLMMEATSMGTLSLIYQELAPGTFRRKISTYYGVPDKVFESWLHHLVYIRNTCAHHSRLWNKNLTIQALVPVHPANYFPEIRKGSGAHVYLTLCIIKYLQNTVKPTNTFSTRLKNLISNYPLIDVRAMGFPDGWKENPLWK